MNERILIVEDELIVADDLAWQLTQIGSEVVGIAVSGQEALALAEKEKPDVILMDIQLQGSMSGIDAAQMIRRKSEAAVIFVSAFGTLFSRDAEGKPPPGICLGKPFSTVQLRAALQAATASPPAP